MAVPKRVADRILSGMKRLVPVIQQQKDRDISEADTVMLIKDLLSEVFGYDKYADVTAELCIRGTYCDLAIRLDGKMVELIEGKAIGIELNERHVKQANDYASNQGIEWVILSNAAVWQLYHVVFAKPIDKQLVAQIDLIRCDPRKEEDLELLYMLTKEGFKKGLHVDLRDKRDATSRFVMAALLLHNEDIRKAIRRELREMADISVPDEDIIKVLRDEVIKRDTLEGPLADEAASRVRRAGKKTARVDVKPVVTSEPSSNVDVMPADSSVEDTLKAAEQAGA
jgi:predicted type IV restriction endonuclease